MLLVVRDCHNLPTLNYIKCFPKEKDLASVNLNLKVTWINRDSGRRNKYVLRKVKHPFKIAVI